MKEWLGLGPTPTDTSCEQVGPNCNPTKMRHECKMFVAQLERTFPETVGRYRVKSHPHDFGAYLDVEIGFDPENESEVETAYHVEANTPRHWDPEAYNELVERWGIKGVHGA